MKKILIAMLISSLIMLFYSFHLGIQADHIPVIVFPIEQVTIDNSEAAAEIRDGLRDIKGVSRAISINVRILWFFLVLQVILSVIGLVRKAKKNKTI